WDTAGDADRPRLVASGSVSDLAFSPDSRTLAVGFDPGGLAAWDRATGRPRWRHGAGGRPYIAAVSFSHDGRMVVTAGDEGHVGRWDAATGRLLDPGWRPAAESQVR